MDASTRGRILVAEDEPHIRKIFVTLLEHASFEVHVVADGQAAIEHLEGQEPYDLVLLDDLMPGPTGLEILERLQDLDHRRSVPVVMVASPGYRDRALELGAKDLIPKPFSPKKLLARIDEILDDA